MNQEQAKAWLPYIQALADGRKLQRKYVLTGRPGAMVLIDWRDIDGYQADVTDPQSCIRIKPREFKNFALPWEFIDKRWNYATCNSNLFGMNGVVLYESKPEFIEAETVDGNTFQHSWSSMGKMCTWIALTPNEEGINETEWLACRNKLPEGDA